VLPDFNPAGDLPPGIHRATWTELVERFGAQTGQRAACTRRLAHILALARNTGALRRIVVFGSYITTKDEPNDVDLILVMDDDFRLGETSEDSRAVFDHSLAQARYGASVFWVRPAMVIGQTVEEFIQYWQIKRGGGKRGIVELIL
jgi:hypothetical protein